MAAVGTVITATTQVKYGQGKLRGFFCSAASSTPTLAIYDSDAKSTSDKELIASFTPVAGTMYMLDTDGILFMKGLYAVIGNTVTVTLIYE